MKWTATELKAHLDALEIKGQALYAKHGFTKEVADIQETITGPLAALLDELESKARS